MKKAQEAGERGGKVEIRKEHTEIYKLTNFQNSRKTFQVKLPNDWTKKYFRKREWHSLY